MSRLPETTPLLRRDDGGVLIMTAVFLPVLVMMASFVIDIGNWFEHRRHLQLQADAAALAAAGEYSYPCADAAIATMADRYGGVASAGEVHNVQVGNANRGKVMLHLNRRTWPDQPDKIDNEIPATEPGPCASGVVDVKLTEKDLPWFFGFPGADEVVPFINAHARVEIFSVSRASKLAPLGVPDPTPKKARAIFVDEANSDKVIDAVDLERSGTGPDGMPLWHSTRPANVKVNSAHTGVRVVLSGGDSLTCGEPLVQCYSNNELVHIRGWTKGDPSPRNPTVRDAWLSPSGASCRDGYFSPESSSCAVSMEVDVDPGSGVTDPVEELGATLVATVDHTAYGSSTYRLVRDPGAGPLRWKSHPDDLIPVKKGLGPLPIDVKWTVTKTSEGPCTSKCSVTRTDVQRTFAGSQSSSGPIRLVQVAEPGYVSGSNSFERCPATDGRTCEPKLNVTVGTSPGLGGPATAPTDPPLSLRATGDSPATQALDCDPAIALFEDEIAGRDANGDLKGCGPTYTKNTGTACPNKATLHASPQPWECVAVVNAGENQVAKGLNRRILGSEKPTTCTAPNKWTSYWKLQGGTWHLDQNAMTGDPRLMQLFLTPFGAFATTTGLGSNTVPVNNFAYFYVTGWQAEGTGFTNPCATHIPADDPALPGQVVGHFVKYVDRRNDGNFGTSKCVFTDVSSCVAVLTR